MGVSGEFGAAAVHRARRALESALGRPSAPPSNDLDPEWNERAGVFVTLKVYPTADLRGCVGYPFPHLPRGTALDRAAIAAGLEDPRFPPVRAAELDRLIVEVSLLTSPETIAERDAAGRRRAVEVGRHGLIVSSGGASGLLLPQVAVEQGWDAEEFLARTCAKAGLAPDAWRTGATRVERFEAEVFAETSPRGPVVREEHSGARRGALRR